jgi:hypothetical protein
MKKLINFLPILLAAISFTFYSCDEFETLPLNIPISKEITTTGTNTVIVEVENICFDADSPTYLDYKEKIKSLTFLEAAWRTKSVSAGLQGNITLQIRTGNGTVVFSKTIPGVNPAAYQSPNQPYVFQLTEQEIDLINAYIESLNSLCFEATATVQVTGGTSPYQLVGIVDMIFEAETEL